MKKSNSMMMKRRLKMKILIYKCPKCGDKLYSRAHYDFRYCSCKHIALDGGHWNTDIQQFEPERLIGNLEWDEWNNISQIIEVKVTEKQLYDDWNHSIDKYGKIVTKQ